MPKRDAKTEKQVNEAMDERPPEQPPQQTEGTADAPADGKPPVVPSFAERNLHGETPLGCFMIVQDFNPDHWDWTPQEKIALINHDLKEIGNIIYRRLTSTGAVIQALYLVDHDRDMRRTPDGKAYEVKEEHLHIIGKSPRPKGGNYRNAAQYCLLLREIAELAGVETQYVEKPKSGSYSWDNFCAYLIHAKDPEKCQYKPEEVVTVVGTSYYEIAFENKTRWYRAIATKHRKSAKESVDWLEREILNDGFTKDEIMLNDTLFEIYCTARMRLDGAFDALAERKAVKAIEALKRGEFRVSFFFVEGESNAGKSTFAEGLIDKIIKWSKDYYGKPWRFYSGASENALDDYQGEEIVFLDDVRASALTPAGWIKLINPKSASRTKARYHNKRMAARVIIVTGTYSAVDFFCQARRRSIAKDDPLDQFMRRLQMLVHPVYLNQLNPDIMGEETAEKNLRLLPSVELYEPKRLPDKSHILGYTVAENSEDEKSLLEPEKVRSNYVFAPLDMEQDEWNERAEESKKVMEQFVSSHLKVRKSRRYLMEQAINEALQVVIKNNTLKDRGQEIDAKTEDADEGERVINPSEIVVPDPVTFDDLMTDDEREAEEYAAMKNAAATAPASNPPANNREFDPDEF